MIFSERVYAKLDARERGEMPIPPATAVLREQAMDRAWPIQQAVERLLAYMAEDVHFAAVFGRSPEIEFLWEPIVSSASMIRVRGKFGFFNIDVCRHGHPGEDRWTELVFELVPDTRIRAAIRCGPTYTGANGIRADARDLLEFLLMVEDMIAELLADLALTDLGRMYLRQHLDGGQGQPDGLQRDPGMPGDAPPARPRHSRGRLPAHPREGSVSTLSGQAR